MEFLRFLEGIRNPLLDEFFLLITRLGEETLFIVIGLIFFWCISKKEGYYILSIGLVGTVINQFLKIVFRVPRPWIKDPNFTTVGDSKVAATGYSFPSGHTQSSVGMFGSIARWNKNIIIRTVCIVLCVLVGFSRMYLGVHTPADVIVSALVATILIFGFYPIFTKAFENKKVMRIFILSAVVLAISYLLFVSFYKFPDAVDTSNIESGLENGFKLLGCMLGLWVTYEVDTNFTHFDTKATWWVQILKVALGIIPILAIKVLLKQPLYMLIGENYFADLIRYFLLTSVAGALWPMTFPIFNRLSKNK